MIINNYFFTINIFIVLTIHDFFAVCLSWFLLSPFLYKLHKVLKVFGFSIPLIGQVNSSLRSDHILFRHAPVQNGHRSYVGGFHRHGQEELPTNLVVELAVPEQLRRD